MKYIKLILIVFIIFFAIISIFFQEMISKENFKLISFILLFSWISLMLFQKYYKKK